jgi:hypothetical protein
MHRLTYTATATLAAIAYLVSGATVVGHHIPDHHWGARGAIVDAAGAVAFLLTAITLAGLGPCLAAGRAAAIGTHLAQVGLLAMTVESFASLAHGGNTLDGLFFGGLLLTLAGLVALAVAGVRAGELRWLAPLPALALLIGIAGGDHGGFLGTGLAWLVLAFAVRLPRPVAEPLPV